MRIKFNGLLDRRVMFIPKSKIEKCVPASQTPRQMLLQLNLLPLPFLGCSHVHNANANAPTQEVARALSDVVVSKRLKVVTVHRDDELSCEASCGEGSTFEQQDHARGKYSRVRCWQLLENKQHKPVPSTSRAAITKLSSSSRYTEKYCMLLPESGSSTFSRNM